MDPLVLETWTTEAPTLVRVAVGVLGAVVLFWGARIYKPALMMAAWGAGAIGALALLQALSGLAPELSRPLVLLVGAAVGGFAAMGLAAVAHKLALVGVGALAGVVAVASAAEVVAVPWWALLVGALLGAVVLPLVFPIVLKVTTPLAGSVLVAWALGWTNPWMLGGLWLVGAAFQLGFVRERKGEEQAE